MEEVSRLPWAQVENSDIWKDVVKPHLEDKIRDINWRQYQATSPQELLVLQGELRATMDLISQPNTEREMVDINDLMERELPDGTGRATRTRFRRSAR